MLNAILATRQSKKTFQIHFKPTLDSDSMRITHPALFAAVWPPLWFLPGRQ
jgi:hypothetical protein